MIEKKPLGVYIHIPFCERKCLYCDFASAPGKPDEIAYYMRVLLKEIRSFEALGSLYKVKSVFFGGGTPSLLPPLYIEQVLTLLRSQYEFEKDAEISLESNPGTLTEDKLKAYYAMGISRLSMGLQSANEEELKLLGRIHTYKDFLDNYENARKVGFRNINVDLMCSLPRQNMAKWSRTLEKVAALRPEHISAYSLSIEEGTPFYEKYSTRQGRVYLPGEELDREMYHYTGKFLAEQGYHRYEISNYALEGRECTHNLIYWTEGDYIGFGQSAASYVDGRRFANPADKNEYWTYARSAYASYKSTPRLSDKERMEEYMFLGLRTMRGVSREEFRDMFRTDFPEAYEAAIDSFCRRELMEQKNGRIMLTEAGIDVSNRIMAEFLLD